MGSLRSRELSRSLAYPNVVTGTAVLSESRGFVFRDAGFYIPGMYCPGFGFGAFRLRFRVLPLWLDYLFMGSFPRSLGGLYELITTRSRVATTTLAMKTRKHGADSGLVSDKASSPHDEAQVCNTKLISTARSSRH